MVNHKVVEEHLGLPIKKDTTAEALLRRPEITYERLMQVESIGPGVSQADVAEQVAIQIRYAGYLDRQTLEIERQKEASQQRIPDSFDYRVVKSLSAEILEKLERVRPQSIDQASRIPGMTPAAISQLLVYLKRHKNAA